MVLNDGRTYGSRLDSPTPVTSFAIFFRPGMAEEVVRCHVLADSALLDEPAGAIAGEFGESLRGHDARISPVLKFIRRHVERGLDRRGLVRGAAILPARPHAVPARARSSDHRPRTGGALPARARRSPAVWGCVSTLSTRIIAARSGLPKLPPPRTSRPTTACACSARCTAARRWRTCGSDACAPPNGCCTRASSQWRRSPPASVSRAARRCSGRLRSARGVSPRALRARRGQH